MFEVFHYKYSNFLNNLRVLRYKNSGSKLSDAKKSFFYDGIKILNFRFSAGVGITVRGVLEATGRIDDRIILTAQDPVIQPPENRTVRLVDGPNIQEGLIQV